MQTKIFPIGLGAMPLSIDNRPPYAEAIKIIHHFIDMGGNFIDTANIYSIDADHIGENEKLIADALKQVKSAKDIIIATKGGGTRPNNGWGFGEGHPVQIRAACEKSLQALNLDCIDLYYLHGPDPKVPFEETIIELDKLQKEGKIKHIGIANVNLEQIKQAINITKITAVQNRCNTFCKMDLENGLVNFCQQNNIVYVAYCPLGGWYDHQQLAQDELYNNLRAKYHASAYQLNLSWLLQKADNLIPIPGIDRREQIDENFNATRLKLELEDILIIDSFPNRYNSIAS